MARDAGGGIGFQIPAVLPVASPGDTGIAFAFKTSDDITAFADEHRGGFKAYSPGQPDRVNVHNGGWGARGGGPYYSEDGKIERVLENSTPYPIIGAIWVYPMKSR